MFYNVINMNVKVLNCDFLKVGPMLFICIIRFFSSVTKYIVIYNHAYKAKGMRSLQTIDHNHEHKEKHVQNK